MVPTQGSTGVTIAQTHHVLHLETVSSTVGGKEEPVVIVPGDCYVDSFVNADSAKAVEQMKDEIKVSTGCGYPLASVENWSGYKGHAFFEASSIRKIGDTYYFVYNFMMHKFS